MVTEDRHDAILVKIKDYDENTGKQIDVACYYTTAFEQTLKMFITAKEYNLSCVFNNYSCVIDEKYMNCEHGVSDVRLGFGSSEDIPVIEVWI